MPKNAKSPSQDYEVGYSRPPRNFQFKKGESGNPSGERRKGLSVVPSLKALLERALNRTVTLGDREQKKIVTKAAAGIEQLVNQFATGDHRARRDLIALAGMLGVDLTAGHGDAIKKALGKRLPMEDQALVDDYIRRRLAELDLEDEFDARVAQRKDTQDKPEEK